MSSAPSRSPPTAAESTSPASRRSVVSATRRRSSSSATTVTAWWRMSRSISARLAGVLGGDEPGLRRARRRARRASRRAARAPRAARSGCAGTKPRASPRRARSRSSAPTAATASASRSRRKAWSGLELAAAVEDERGAADERGDRGDDRVEPALAEHDPLEALLGGDRAAQQRVLLVDEPRERPLGDRDERRVVRHLEEREAARLRRRRRRPSAPSGGRSRCRSRGRRGRGRRAARRTRAGPWRCRAPCRW